MLDFKFLTDKKHCKYLENYFFDKVYEKIREIMNLA